MIAGLLLKAVEERERRRPTDLVERMWRIRESGREVTEEEIRRARPRMRRAAGHMAVH